MVDSLLNICRACLAEQGEFQSVFVSDESSGLNIHLAEMLMACASIQVTFGDGLPEQICKTCAEKTVSLFLFKLKCEESDSRLRNQLGKSPFKEEYISIPFDGDVDIPDQNIDLENTGSPNSHNEEKVDLDIDEKFSDDKNFRTLEDFETGATDNSSFFKCKLCPKVYNRSSNLLRHEKFHMNEQLFKCEICDKKFTRKDLLDRHKLAHARKNNQELDVSMLGSSKDETLIKYEDVNDGPLLEYENPNESIKDIQDNDTKEEKLNCDICKKKFFKHLRLKRHMKIHSEDKPFVCQICSRGFSRQEFYKNHMTIHTGIKPHVCDICKKGFNQISNLKDHLRTHNGERPFLCSICGKGFNQLGNLRQHAIRHSGIKAHICNMCGNGFASKGELSAHLRKHTGARPFVCSVCQRGFTTSSSLTKHKRIHSGEKPYECDVCHMKFSRNGILARHKRIHTGEKPYVCKYCSKGFTQSNDLNSHLRIHTGEKPYICDECGQAFRQSSALKTHKRTHLGMKPLLNVEIENRNEIDQTVEAKPFLEARFDFETSTWTYIKQTEENILILDT